MQKNVTGSLVKVYHKKGSRQFNLRMMSKSFVDMKQVESQCRHRRSLGGWRGPPQVQRPGAVSKEKMW